MIRFQTRGRALRRQLVVCGIVASLGFANARDATDRVDGYLRHRSGPSFSGVVLIARHGNIVFERGYGLADADLGVKNEPGLRFGIGSLTKPITAAAVMRFVERGRLRLSDPICLWVVPCPPAWRVVTLEHLLSHTSGIPDLLDQRPAVADGSPRALVEAIVAQHRQDALRSRPGERYAYSDFGYFLLGDMLEVATGQPWESVLRQEVFVPAGMGDTEYDDPRRVRDNYGLGWQVTTAFGRLQRNHTGVTSGFSSHLAHYDDGITVIVLSNVEEEPVRATACDIAAIMFGLKPSSGGATRGACRR